MRIGPYSIDPPLILAPMAGVTDRPFRQLCRKLGAGLAVSEMTTSDPTLWHTEKSRLRRDHAGEAAPIAVQIAGTDPQRLAEAARFNVEHGAQIIDINMGCPAKKVCRVDAGSALLRDEPLVARICEATVQALAPVPVTLKIRTGYSRLQKNALTIARIAEDAGIAALAIHGRTREDHFEGEAEYATIAAVKQAVRIPVIANGDVLTPAAAKHVLAVTGADALMIGRGAQGNPWIFGQIADALAGRPVRAPSAAEVGATLLGHLDALYSFYGEGRGLRVARKHIQWYCQAHTGGTGEALWQAIRTVECARTQRAQVQAFFESLSAGALARAA